MERLFRGEITLNRFLYVKFGRLLGFDNRTRFVKKQLLQVGLQKKLNKMFSSEKVTMTAYDYRKIFFKSNYDGVTCLL